MDDLIQAMSIKELEEFKVTYKDNESASRILDGYIEAKKREEEKEQAKADFEKQIAKLTTKLPHPEDIYNVYLRWAEVDEPTGGTEEVEVVDVEGNKTMEMRTPTTKVYKWVVEVNKGFAVKATGNATTATTRRVKTVYRKGVDGSLVQVHPDTPITTWTEWREYLNSHPDLLTKNGDGKPILVIGTSASGLVDLKTAGFIGITA